MLSDRNMRSRRLESPYIVVRILNSLKGFYTFKELEEKTGIPFQVLWRYTSLTSIPEKRTAKRIIDKIEEQGLIENIIERVIVKNSHGYIESWRYLYNPRFLGLIGYEAAKFTRGEKIDAILTFPQEDAPLALVVSEWLGVRVYVGFTYLKLEIEKYLQVAYISLDRGRMVNVYVPRGILRKGDNVLVVRNIAKDWDSLKALLQIVESRR